MSIIGIVVVTALSLHESKEKLIYERQNMVQTIVLMAENESKYLLKAVYNGEMTKKEAKERFISTLEGFADSSLYVFAYNGKGDLLANLTSSRDKIGQNFYDLKDVNGVPIVKVLLEKAKSGDRTPTYYHWVKPGINKVTEKVSYSAYVKEFDMMIGSGSYMDEIESEYYSEVKKASAETLIAVLILSLIVYLIASGIVNPINHLIKVMNNMAKEDYNDVIDTKREDEIGKMNIALDSFKISLLNSKALEEQQRKDEQEKLEKAAFVGDATKKVSDAVFEIDEHITGISSSASELSSTLEDIARKVDDTSEMTRLAESEAEKGAATVQGLNQNSEKIGDVVKLIQSIADKTNLLALNASIEAARAGEEGRGFAVVAEEVKKLAQQTREATDGISDQVKQVQAGSSSSVKAIENINEQITAINNFAQELVLSISEQKEATNDISNRMEHASSGSKFVSDKMKEIVENV